MPFRRTKAGEGRRRIRKLRLLAVALLLGVLGLASFTFGLVTAIAREVPSLDPARQLGQEVNGYIYDREGKRILAVLRGSESRVLVDWKSIDPLMVHAIVAVEDRRFWDHNGVDVRGIARALLADIRAKEFVEGASTITQQFVKNASSPGERRLGEKVREAALAWQLQQHWSKKRILTAYLNTIFFGNGAYGVQQAARTYFNKGAGELTLAESALLAGIPQDPSRFDPAANPRAAKKRRAVVLQTMLEQRIITRRAYRKARRAPMPDRERIRLPGIEGPAHYFVNYVKQQLVDRYGTRRVFGGGLRVRTTIDLDLQRIARGAIGKWLTAPGGPSAALVAVDPRSGAVLAMVGGNNFRESQFNLAVQGERQAGSAFKPIVLAEALEQGISPATSFVSKPTAISLGDRLWAVKNYEDAYLGATDLETATTHSDNAVYAQLTQLVTPAKIVRRAKQLGITSDLRSYFSIGLGAEAVNPLEMARAFSAFANGGFRIDGSLARISNRPRAIVSVREGPGGPLKPNRVLPRRVLTIRSAALVNSLLQTVVQQGTGRRAALPDGRPAAGKTGTTENYGDAWFVGYTPQLVTAVWVGDPERLRPMLTDFHGEPVAGGTFPALIWRTFTERALKKLGAAPETFAPPSGAYASPSSVVVRAGELQLDNGLCHAPKTVWYFTDASPRETANCRPNEVEVPRLVGSDVEAARARLAAQPLTAKLVIKWAEPRQRPGVVLNQVPAGGTLSSFDEVTLVVGRARYGIVPKVVGLPLRRARLELERSALDPRVVRFTSGKKGRVLFQAPKGGLAAAPSMEVKLVVGKGG